MTVTSPSATRRVLIAGAAAAGAAGLLPATMRAAFATDALRQFRIDVPEAELADLRRRIEARLNAQPEFVPEIDGLDVQFTHVRSRHTKALPIIITHAWPGSVLELLKVAGPLTDPTAHGGRDEDAFHVALPSMPGCGVSAQPQGTGGCRKSAERRRSRARGPVGAGAGRVRAPRHVLSQQLRLRRDDADAPADRGLLKTRKVLP